MKADNPISSEFLQNFPVEAARVLEHVAAEDVAALFTELTPETTIPVLVALLPNFAAACLTKMAPLTTARLLTSMPISHAAHLYRLLSSATQTEVAAHLSDKVHSRMYRFLEYIPLSAGDLMNHTVTMLPEELTVAEAIHRLERMRHSVGCEIYITDNSHRLLGVVELGKLMTSKHHARLRDIMQKKTPSISTHAALENMLSHPGWATHQRLPVVERDNSLVGVLDITVLQEAAGNKTIRPQDPLENLLSLVGLYWLSLSQLLDSLLSIGGANRGERQ